MSNRLLVLPDYKHTCPRYTTGDIKSQCLACAYENGAKDQDAKTAEIVLKEVARLLELSLEIEPGHQIKDIDCVRVHGFLKKEDWEALKKGEM